MQCFKLPNSICDDIERMCASFWWGDKEEKRRVHWKKWEELCKPKCLGGMGFRDIKKFNLALLAKQLWRFLVQPDLLVSRVFKLRYSRDGDLMDATAKSGCSFVWRSIIGSKGALEEGERWKVGKGEVVRVYKDKWVGGYGIERLKGVEGKVEVDTNVKHLLGENGDWDEEVVNQLFHAFERDAILRTERVDKEAQDRRWWELEPKGQFSVKSCYLAQMGFYRQHENTSKEDRKQWSRLVWQVSVPPEVRVFLWKACMNAIPTLGNLRDHHVPVDGTCLLCRDRWATTEHMMFFCPKIRGLWKESRFWFFLKEGRGATFLEIATFMEREMEVDEYAIWCIMVWKVWSYICEISYGERREGGLPSEEDSRGFWNCFQKAKAVATEEMKLGIRCGARRWELPREGVVRVDVDALYDEKRRRYGVGVIIRDWKGEIRAAMARPTNRKANVMIAELMAVVDGIILSLKVGVEVISIYTDSLLVARLMVSEEEMNDLLLDDIGDIIWRARGTMLEGVHHMYRSANRVAHALAQRSTDFEYDLV